MNLSVLVSESTDKLKPLLRPRKTICEVKNIYSRHVHALLELLTMIRDSNPKSFRTT